jgi:hypothetical protein
MKQKTYKDNIKRVSVQLTFKTKYMTGYNKIFSRKLTFAFMFLVQIKASSY